MKFKVGDKVRVIRIPDKCGKCGGCFIGEERIVKSAYGGHLGAKKINSEIWCSALTPEYLELTEKQSPYSSLRARIEVMNGNTTLQEFGELLLQVGEKDTFLCLPTAIYPSSGIINHFYLRKNGEQIYQKDRGGLFGKPCDAIPALRNNLLWLLDHSSLKNDKQEKIEEIKTQIAELNKRIEEMENGKTQGRCFLRQGL